MLQAWSALACQPTQTKASMGIYGPLQRWLSLQRPYSVTVMCIFNRISRKATVPCTLVGMILNLASIAAGISTTKDQLPCRRWRAPCVGV